MQSLNIFDAVEFMGFGWFAIIHFTNSLEAILLQIVPVGDIAEGPSKRVAEVDASGDCSRAVIKRYDVSDNDAWRTYCLCKKPREPLHNLKDLDERCFPRWKESRRRIPRGLSGHQAAC